MDAPIVSDSFWLTATRGDSSLQISHFVQIYNDTSENADCIPSTLSKTIFNKKTNELNSDNIRFTIKPNPAANTVTIESEGLLSEDCRVSFHDITGRLISAYVLHESNIVLDVSKFPRGVYFVYLQHGSDFWQEKLILRE